MAPERACLPSHKGVGNRAAGGGDGPGWQQVEQEATQELFDRESHEPLLVAVGGVAPAEGDVAVGKSNQPPVGNGDAMSVSAEIAQHMFWPAERPLGVDDPVVTEQYPQPRGEGAGFRKR